MKKIFKLIGIIAVIAIIGFSMACSGGDGGGGGGTGGGDGNNSTPEPGKDAVLSKLLFDNDEVNLGTAITSAEWENVTALYNLNTQQTAIYLLVDANKSVAIIPTAGVKDKVEVAVTDNYTKPATFNTQTSIQIKAGDYAIFKVTAEDEVTINYYAVSIRTISIYLKIAASDDVYGDRVGSLNALGNLAEINIYNADKNNATVTLTLYLPTVFNDVVTRIVKTGKSETVTDASFTDSAIYNSGSKPVFNFDNEDKIYVKITVANGITVYCAYKVLIKRDASLKSIIFANDYSVNSLGTPANTLAGVTNAGYILMSISQPSPGFNIAVTANDPEAAVTFGKSTDAEGTWTAAAKTIQFADNEFLGVKVVSYNEQITNYYKISVELLYSMEIPRGTPKLYNTTDNSDSTYVDSLWDTIDWIPVSRLNRDETYDTSFYNNPTTTGKAKLYWDEDGLWLYVDVTTNNISTNSGYEHNGSSVELFINEAYPSIKTGNFNDIGGQYRLDSNGAVSGTPSAAATAMTNLNKYKTFRTSGGYAVIFQAPWRFNSSYPITADKDLSLEIQINAADDSKTRRVGVLKWYNSVDYTYQNASALAPGKLKAAE